MRKEQNPEAKQLPNPQEPQRPGRPRARPGQPGCRAQGRRCGRHRQGSGLTRFAAPWKSTSTLESTS